MGQLAQFQHVAYELGMIKFREAKQKLLQFLLGRIYGAPATTAYAVVRDLFEKHGPKFCAALMTGVRYFSVRSSQAGEAVNSVVKTGMVTFCYLGDVFDSQREVEIDMAKKLCDDIRTQTKLNDANHPNAALTTATVQGVIYLHVVAPEAYRVQQEAMLALQNIYHWVEGTLSDQGFQEFGVCTEGSTMGFTIHYHRVDDYARCTCSINSEQGSYCRHLCSFAREYLYSPSRHLSRPSTHLS